MLPVGKADSVIIDFEAYDCSPDKGKGEREVWSQNNQLFQDLQRWLTQKRMAQVPCRSKVLYLQRRPLSLFIEASLGCDLWVSLQQMTWGIARNIY